MSIEQELMRLMKQSHALARRRPQEEQEEGHNPHGRHRGAGHILDLLTETSGVSQQSLADRLGVRPQSVSEAVAALEARGFVRREASALDRRVTLIHITEVGRIHAASLAQERKAHAERFFAVLTAQEKETLRAILTKINTERERDR